MLTPRQQGNLGEWSAVEWFMSNGIPVCVPIGHTPDWDLMAEIEGKAARVQVKTTGCFHKRRWDLPVCTRGGNQSWNRIAKYLDPSRFEYLFALVGDGRRWLIPSSELGGGTAIRLGGPKYAAFEIEPGQSFADRRCRNPASTIRAANARRDTQAVNGTTL
ncbi:MAG TPA: group I intron-associated PD-(D/E)XK endonuclease [Thermoleophilaceae bacterium]